MDIHTILDSQFNSIVYVDNDSNTNNLFYLNGNNDYYANTDFESDENTIWNGVIVFDDYNNSDYDSNYDADSDTNTEPVNDPLTNWYFYDFTDPNPYVECDDDRRYDLNFESNN